MKRHSDALDTLIKVKHEGTTRDLLCCLEATTVAQLEARVRGLFPSLSSAPLRMLGGGIILSNQAPHTLLAHFKGKVKTIQVLAQKQSLEEVKAQETKVMEREDLLQEETDYDKILERQEYVPWWGRSPLSKFNAIQSYTPKERLELARHAAYTGNMPVLKHLLVRGYLEQPDPSHAFDMIQVSSFSPPPSFSPYKKNMFLFPSQVMEAAIQSQCREHQVAMVEHINQSAFVHALAPGGHARLLAPLTVQCLPQAAKLGRMAILRHFLSPGNYDNVNDSTLGELAQTAFDGGHSKVGQWLVSLGSRLNPVTGLVQPIFQGNVRILQCLHRVYGLPIALGILHATIQRAAEDGERTPLDTANRKLEIVRYVFSNIDPCLIPRHVLGEWKNEFMQTALSRGHGPILKFLDAFFGGTLVRHSFGGFLATACRLTDLGALDETVAFLVSRMICPLSHLLLPEDCKGFRTDSVLPFAMEKPSPSDSVSTKDLHVPHWSDHLRWTRDTDEDRTSMDNEVTMENSNLSTASHELSSPDKRALLSWIRDWVDSHEQDMANRQRREEQKRRAVFHSTEDVPDETNAPPVQATSYDTKSETMACMKSLRSSPVESFWDYILILLMRASSTWTDRRPKDLRRTVLPLVTLLRNGCVPDMDRIVKLSAPQINCFLLALHQWECEETSASFLAHAGAEILSSLPRDVVNIVVDYYLDGGHGQSSKTIGRIKSEFVRTAFPNEVQQDPSILAHSKYEWSLAYSPEEDASGSEKRRKGAPPPPLYCTSASLVLRTPPPRG